MRQTFRGRSSIVLGSWICGLLTLGASMPSPASQGPAGFAVRPLEAQEVRGFVTPEGSIEVGRTFMFSVEVTGAQTFDREPAPPEIGAFAQYLGSQTQSSMQMVNGRTTVSLTIQYRFQALAEGEFSIPPVDVGVAGRTLSTASTPVRIVASGQGGASAQDDVLAADDLFVTAESRPTSVWEGEPFIVEYRIWTRVDVSNYGLTRIPEPEGFWVEDLTPPGQPEIEQRTRGGSQYTTAVIRRVALVPTGPGVRTIEPIGVEAQVRVRERRDPFSGFFGRSPFGSIAVPTSVVSNAIEVEVRPLPPGRPEPFSGVVGALSLSATLDRDSVASNEAVTLTVSVTGEGNLRAVPPPDLGLPPDFEVFPPEVTESVRPTATGLTGTRRFEYVLIPRAPGAREIPRVEMGFFDLEAGAYGVAGSGPLPLTVSGTAIEGGAAVARGGVARLREDIRFIQLGPMELRRTDGTVFRTPGFWLLMLLPLTLLGSAVAYRRHRDLVEGDLAYARGRRAGRLARKRLGEARRLLDGGDPRAFYAEIARALRGLAADRLNVAEAGLQAHALDGMLAGAGAGEAVRERLRRALDICDRQRFAPPTVDRAERLRFLEEAEGLMTDLDREIR